MTAESETLSTGPESANGVSGSAHPGGHGNGLDIVGGRVREERLRQKIGVRELARRVGVSASLISQVELGKASPSVGTLYAIVNELGLSLDELFFRGSHGQWPRNDRSKAPGGNTEAGPAASPAEAPQNGSRAGAVDLDALGTAPVQEERHQQPPWGVKPVVRQGEAQVIQLGGGVRWERLAPPTPQDVDFLEVFYEAGSESCAADSLMRHAGHEYGHIISGRLGVTIGFDTHELGPGDSIAFDSTLPHRLFALGEERVDAIWVVVGRRGDPHLNPGH